MFLQDIRIVLCQASKGGNVGAVCRVMKNMGLSGLRLAAALSLDSEQIYTRAVHAEDIWEKAQFFENLAEATADCAIIVGTTRRRGRKRKVSMLPKALAEWLGERSGPAAIVFGGERTGLEDSELELCNIASHIPVLDTQPSLNLSHAVQIYAYELFLALEQQNSPVKGEWQPMNQSEISALVASITDTFASLGFYRHPNRKEQTRFLQDIISRAGLMEREGNYLKDILVKAARLAGNRRELPPFC